MKRPTSLPVFVQVATLAVLAVVMSQAVTFGVVILAPSPRPPGFGIEAAASALSGKPAETSDGRTLRRRITDRPVTRTQRDETDPVASAIAGALARRLAVTPDRVQVSLEHNQRPRPGMFGGPPPGPMVRFNGPMGQGGFRPPGPMMRQDEAMPRNPEGGPGGDQRFDRGPDGARGPSPEAFQQFQIRADRLTFAPFSASVRQDDGQWATVEPPRGLLAPWQMRMLIVMAVSIALLAPLAWWMARRLTRPIRAFAEAAERLGADPDAEPLAPSGPTEVRTAIAAFNDMQASLRDHMRKRTQTIAAIAHDLRTPLTRLRFRAELAPDTLRDRMAADIEEMDALIGQAMAYVRGEIQPEHRERFDLTELVRACSSGFADTGEPVTFVEGRPIAVDADPAGLRRALANLIGNAVKYADGARVATALHDGMAVVTVDDDGPGLPPEDIEAVFEPFARGERSRNRETGGAGLGLAVARQVARGHGGDVVLVNRPGGGLTARLSLPLS